MNLDRIKFGWKRQLPDFRDFKLPPRNRLERMPQSATLQSFFPPVYDQGSIGSCTSNAIAAALDYERGRQGEPFITPSRLFLYYSERDIEGTTGFDAGADIRDGIKSVADTGDCPESDWPYDETQLTVKPPEMCYSEALRYRAVNYYAVNQDLASIKGAIVRWKPVVFGIVVYDSFMTDTVASTGVVPMPGADENLLGGHAIVAIGYDDRKQSILCRNSWGPAWGYQNGHFWLPYAYMINPSLASDFWSITTVL